MIKDFLHRLLGARTSPSNDYLYRTRLPSELLGVFFDATIEVHALLDQTQPALEARMFRKLEDAASLISARFSVLDSDRAAFEVTIGLHDPIPGLPLRIDRVRVRLSADASAIETARAVQDAVQKTTLIQMRYEEQVRQYRSLRDHFLQNPSLARMWWIREDPNRLTALADLSANGKPDPFETAVRLLRESTAEDAARNEVAAILETFLRELPPEARKYLISQLAQILNHYERPELAGELLSTREAS